MDVRPMKHALFPLLALCAAFVIAVSAQAQDRHDRDAGGMSATIQITFGSNPHWASVRGTHVREIRAQERPDYDIFRCGGGYYVYRDDHWYMSRRPRGEFRLIEERLVPVELARVPREHWRHYPPAWADRHGDDRGNKRDRGHHGDPQEQQQGDHGHH